MRLTNTKENRKGQEPFEYWLKDSHPLGQIKAIERLADYEDAEEQGLLLRLPCKVGDTVYVINRRDNLITKEKVRDVQYRGESYQKGKRFFMNIGASIFFEDEFGKLVFFDRKKAKSALAEKGGAE